MKHKKLSPNEHVIRQIRPSYVLEINGQPTILPQAFRLRLEGEGNPPREEDEEYLSSAWYEFFTGSDAEILKQHKDNFNNTRMPLRPNSVLAQCNVGQIEECGEAFNAKIKCRHTPKKINLAYAKIQGIKPKHQQNDELPAAIASRTIINWVRAKNIT